MDDFDDEKDFIKKEIKKVKKKY